MAEDRLLALKEHVTELATSDEFKHRDWYVPFHLEFVERIAGELLALYPHADATMVNVLIWMHDVGKMIDPAYQYQATLTYGRKLLPDLGFDEAFVQRAIDELATLDRSREIDLHQASIEVRIVSSADGCSHMVGPFMPIWWHENPARSTRELMADNLAKLAKDWNRKIVLPEAREAFASRYAVLREMHGEVPVRLLKPVLSGDHIGP